MILPPMTLGARPEHMVFDDAGISSRVLLAEPTGPDQYVRLAVAGSELTARSGPEQIFKSGSDAGILVDGARMTLFDPQSGQALLGS